MSLDFPNTPADGERSVQPNGVTYEWQATKERWISITTLGGSVVGGTVVQEQTVQTSDRVIGTGTLVTTSDATPQITDGVLALTIPFTPKYATSQLKIECNLSLWAEGTNKQLGAALFQDAIADAIGASAGNWCAVSGEANQISFTTVVDAGSVDSRTYTVRIGAQASAQYAMNGTSVGRTMGGAQYSGITITEIQPNAIVEPILPSPLEIFVNGVAQEPVSETDIDFAIPAGVKEVKVTFGGLANNTTAQTLIQLGSGVPQTTGYVTNSARLPNAAAIAVTNRTDGFAMSDISANWESRGTVTFTLVDAATNRWSGSGVSAEATQVNAVGGGVALTGELSILRVTSIGGAAVFNAGTINVQYDNQGQEATILPPPDSGSVVQVQNFQTGAEASGAVTIGFDTTAPIIAEGLEVMALAFTPKYANSQLKIDVVANSSTNVVGEQTAALFEDAINTCIACASRNSVADRMTQVCFTHFTAAASVDERTYTIRVGNNTGASTTIFNALTGSRDQGGSIASSITITEIAG